MIRALFEAFCNLFRKPITVDFPFSPPAFAPECRGEIGYNAEACIFCLLCEKACPTGAIVYVRDADGRDTHHYNAHLCIFCGDCVRECPKPNEALWQTNAPVFSTTDQMINKGWDAVENEAVRTKGVYKKRRN